MEAVESASQNVGGGRGRRLVRDKPEDFVAGWFFPIAIPAFIGALDVERSERAETKTDADGVKRRRVWYVWSQRNPPQYSFEEGDIFHAPHVEPGCWGDQLLTIRWSIQIRRIEGDAVTIRVTQYREETTSEHDVVMDELATFLRTGVLPLIFDFTAAIETEDCGD